MHPCVRLWAPSCCGPVRFASSMCILVLSTLEFSSSLRPSPPSFSFMCMHRHTHTECKKSLKSKKALTINVGNFSLLSAKNSVCVVTSDR